MIHTVVSIPIAFAVNVVVARILGVLDYGRLAFLSTLMDLVGGLVAMGAGIGLVQFGSKAHAAGRAGEVQGLLSKTQGFRLLIDVPVMTLLVVVFAHVATPILVAAVVFGVLVPAALNGAPSCLAIENKTEAGAKTAMLTNLVTQVAVLAAVFGSGTADAVWTARVAAGGVAVAAALLWINPSYRRAVLHPSLPSAFPAGFWAFALPAGAAGFLASLVVSRTEVLALTWLGQPAAAGAFALAFGLAGHIFAPAQALTGPLIPAISALREVDTGAVAVAFRRSVRGMSTVVALLVSGLLPAFAALVPLIYGEQYANVPIVVIALGIAGGFLVMTGPIHAFMQARLNAWPLLRVNLLALAIDVGLAVLLIPSLGVWGAVIANAGGATSRLVLLASRELRALGVAWSRGLRDSTPLFVGALSCMAAWLIVTAMGLNAITTCLCLMPVGWLLYIVGLRIMHAGLTQQDADAILDIVPSWLRPAGRSTLAFFSHSLVEA